MKNIFDITEFTKPRVGFNWTHNSGGGHKTELRRPNGHYYNKTEYQLNITIITENRKTEYTLRPNLKLFATFDKLSLST